MSAPYDSLVEYISSSGTQYIDTGYAFADGFAFEVDFRYATSNRTVFGARASSVRTAVVYYSVTNGLVVNMAGYSGSSTPFKFAGATVTDRHVLKMEVSGGVGTTWLDGVKVHDAVSFSGAYISGVTQAIFATKYGDNDFRDISATTIYGVRMWQGGTLVRDYVPARVGTGGELYDRVSGTLAARVGTLTAGPDKAEPVPSPVGIGGTMLIAARESFAVAARKRGWTNPYVTDGLIAMWDGEWNAGGGIHDASATTWKNLVDGSSFGDGASAASYPPVWGADYCRNQAGASGQKQVFSVSAPLAATQSIVCAEEVARAVSKAADVSSGWHEIQRFSVGVGFFRGDVPTFGVLGNIVLWPSATQYQPWRAHNSTISSSLDPYVRRSYHSSRSGSTLYMRVNGGTRLTMTRGNGVTLGVPTTYPLIMSHSCVLEACCIRLYSRELTDDERAANLAIDKERFGLT